MKKLSFVLVAGACGAALLLFVQSCGILGGPPTGVQVGADNSGLRVMVVWTTPAEGAPDKYLIHFRPVGDTGYQLVAETTATSLFHDPQGVTGTYRVTARYGGDDYQAEEMPTTVPVRSDTVTVAELDAPGKSGFGWSRNDGTGGTYSMLDPGNAAFVDCYITDFAVGSGRLPYCVASPNKGPDDEAGLVPAGDWRVNGFTDSMPSSWGEDTVPAISPDIYFDYTSIDYTPITMGFYSVDDEYYGLIRVLGVSPGTAEVTLESWFQLVPRLRLVAH